MYNEVQLVLVLAKALSGTVLYILPHRLLTLVALLPLVLESVALQPRTHSPHRTDIYSLHNLHVYTYCVTTSVYACMHRARPLPDYSRLAAAGVYHHNSASSSNTSVLQLTDPQPFKLSTEARGEVKSERAKAIIAAQEAAAAAAREVSYYYCLITIYIYIYVSQSR
jgi:ribosomal protein L30E